MNAEKGKRKLNPKPYLFRHSEVEEDVTNDQEGKLSLYSVLKAWWT
jgi:hypothetical protein